MAYSKSYGLIMGAALIALALPALAQHEPIRNIPPNQSTVAQIPPTTPPEIMIEPQATANSTLRSRVAGNGVCVNRNGFIEGAGQPLPAVYMTGVLKEFDQSAQQNLDYNDRDPYTAGIENGGTLSMNGVSYPLVAIEIGSAYFPISSIRYDMSFNFIHRSEQDEIVIVSVPVKQGAMNIGAQQILGSVDIPFDPNSLLPDNRSAALIEETTGEMCPVSQRVHRYMLMTPIEVSKEQLEGLLTQC